MEPDVNEGLTHMPRLQCEQRGDDVETIRRQQREDDIAEDGVTEDGINRDALLLDALDADDRQVD